MTGRRRSNPLAQAVPVLADGSIQVDLFGVVEAELARQAEAERTRREFETRAQCLPDGSPVLWTAPYDTLGARRGETRPGWRCWLCGGVEANEYVLGLVHGLHATDPDCLTRAHCLRQNGGAR